MDEQSSRHPIRVIEAAAALDEWGGIEKSVINLQNGLSRAGFEICVCCTQNTPIAREAGASLTPFELKKPLTFQRFLQYNRAFKRFKPDIVHAHFSPDYLPAGLAAKVQRVPHSVLTRHMALRWSPTKAKLYGQLFSKMVCVSHAVERCLIESNIAREKLRVIYGGIEPAPSPLNSRPHGLPNSLVYLGRLVPEKGIVTLLQAVQKCPTFSLKIWGQGPQEAEIKGEVDRLNLIDRVHLQGYSPCVDDALQPGSILVVPSECDDALPTVVLEAFVRKIPVIATARGGIPEMITDGQSGLLFPSNDASALAKAIQRFALEPTLYDRLSESGFLGAQCQFSLEQMGGAYAELFRSLASKN